MYKILMTSVQTRETYTYATRYKLKADAIRQVNQLIKNDRANKFERYIYTVVKG